jgi:hypothetical protein
MPSARNEPQDLSERVARWLEGEGYPFELRVAHAFRESGWTPQLGQLFVDVTTKKSRACDIHAVEAQHQIGENLQVSLACAVEAKTNAHHPWVGLTSTTTLTPDMASVVCASGYLGTALLRLPGLDPSQLPLLLHQAGAPLAHSLVAAFTKRNQVADSQAFSAVQAAMAAAAAYGDYAGKRLFSQTPGPVLLQLMIPLVVAEGALFEYSMTSSGEARLTEVEMLRVVVDNPLRPGSETLTWVVNIAALPTLLVALHAEARELARAAKARLPGLKSELQAMIRSFSASS